MTFIFTSLSFVFFLMAMTPLAVLASFAVPSHIHILIGVTGLMLFIGELALLERLDAEDTR